MIALEDVGFVGDGLVRPECVLAHCSGLLIASDWAGPGGIALVGPDGQVQRIVARDWPAPLRPNGIALEPGGSVLLAHLGPETGGVFRLRHDGTVEPVLTEVAGRPLPPTNFVLRDAEGRLWITVSTRRVPRSLGYRADVADGFVVLLEGGRARIVADGLGYTNECALAPDGRTLFVNETFARRISAFAIAADGRLSGRRTVARFGSGTFPDGLTLDEAGGLWVVSIVSNRVIRVAPDGASEVVLEDCDAVHLDRVEAAYRSGALDRPHLDTIVSRRLRNVSNIAFGGPDRRTAYLGCLLGERIAHFKAPCAGIAPSHWGVRLGPLARAFGGSP